jgi:outer membrane protein
MMGPDMDPAPAGLANQLWNNEIGKWSASDFISGANGSSHPAVRAADADVQIARKRVDLVKSESGPTVDFSADYYHARDKGYVFTTNRALSNSIGVSVTIPIFDGFANKSRVSAALAQVDRKTEEARSIKQAVESEISQAFADVEAFEKIVQECKDNIAFATEAYASSSRRYGAGYADIEELLNSQQIVFDANLAYGNAVSNLQRARIKLLLASGRVSVTYF